MCFDRPTRLLNRLGQTLRGIGGIVRAAQIQQQLIGIVEVTLAAMAERPLDRFRERQLKIHLLATQLLDRIGLGMDRAGQLFDQCVAAHEILRKGDPECRVLACCITHANQHSE
jgi:hypothetical protein